jgi:hypothetical protein
MGFRNLETTAAGLGSMEGNIRKDQFLCWAVAPVQKKNKVDASVKNKSCRQLKDFAEFAITVKYKILQ